MTLAGDLAAAIVVPAGYSAAALAGRPVALEDVRSADKRLNADVAEAIVRHEEAGDGCPG